MFKIKGELKVINDEVQITDKFKKREFVIVENSSQYPQFLNFQLTQERCSLLDDFKIGQMLVVDFNLTGREWTDKNGITKYFNSLNAWRLADENKTEVNLVPQALESFTDFDDEVELPF